MEFLAGAALVAPQRPSRFLTVGENGTNVRFISSKRDPNALREWENEPGKYDAHIESLREKEYPQLLETSYLDHAGATVPSTSLVTTVSKDLSLNLFGNSQSASPSSHLSRKRVKSARTSVLSFLKADPENFDIIFTSSTTAAIKLVREAFVGSRDGFRYAYHRDCPVSLIGLRESAMYVTYFESDADVEKWIHDGSTLADDDTTSPPLQLFAYSAQSDFSGYRCPLFWSGKIRSPAKRDANTTGDNVRTSTADSTKLRQRGVYTLVDASSYLQTSPILLNDPSTAPDFICLSFDKILGFPDLGALVVNKTTGAAEFLSHMKMHKGSPVNYFGEGVIDTMINSKHHSQSWHALKSQTISPSLDSEGRSSTSNGDIHHLFEDNALPIHSLVALQHAFDFHKELFGRLESIQTHTSRLIKALTDELSSIRHANGRRAIEIYKDSTAAFGDAKTQGPIVAFSVISAEGQYIGKTEVERAAIATGIQLQTGDFSTPGAVATHLGLEPWELRRNYVESLRCAGAVPAAGAEHDWSEGIDIIGGKPTGVVRISLGAMSCMKDIQKLTRWLRWWFVGPDIHNEGTGLGSYDVGQGLSLNLGTRFEGSVADTSPSKLGEHERIESLVAIEGTEAVEVLRRRVSGGAAGMGRRKATREAMKVWEKEWAVVSLEEGMEGVPVSKEMLARAKLKTKLMPEEGVMVVERERGLLDRVVKEERKVEIDLWVMPPASKRSAAATGTADDEKYVVYGGEAVGEGVPKIADRYMGEDVRRFVSAAVGVPCTLARYRSRYLNTKQWRCVKVGCGGIEDTGDDLWSHYEQHVKELQQWEAAIEDSKAPKEPEVKRSDDKMRLSIPGRKSQSAPSEKRSRSRSRVASSKAREKMEDFRRNVNMSMTNVSLPSMSIRGRSSAQDSARQSLAEAGVPSIREEASVYEGDDGKSLKSVKIEENDTQEKTSEEADPMPDDKEVKMKIEQQVHRAFSNPGSNLSTTKVGDNSASSVVSAKEEIKVDIVPNTVPENAVAIVALPPPPPAPEADDQSIQERKKSTTDKKSWKGYALVMKAKVNRGTSGLAALTTKKSKVGLLSANRDVDREGLVEMDGASLRSWGTRGRGRARERVGVEEGLRGDGKTEGRWDGREVPEGVVEMEA